MTHTKLKALPFCTRITNAYIACMATVFLLYPGFGGYETITASKATLFFLLTGLYVAGLILLRLELSIIGSLPFPNLRSLWSKMGLPRKLILLYWLFSLLSTLCSNYKDTALKGNIRCEGFITLTLYCFAFLLISYFAKPGPWLLWLFAGSMTINCILAVFQLAGYNPLSLFPDGMTYYDAFKLYSGQFLGTVGNVDLLSAVFCISIPILWLSLLKLKGKRRFLLLIPLVLCLSVLFSMFVSGGVLGVLLGFLLTLPVIARKKLHRTILFRLVLMLLLFALLAVYFIGDHFTGFLYEAHQILHGSIEDSFGSGRIYIWRKALELVKERPLLGGGPDTMALRTDAMFERYDESLGMLITTYVDTAHNEYLNILVNQGIFALLTYLGALLTAAILWIKAAPTNTRASIYGGAVLCYCIQAIFGISAINSAPYFWITFGLLIQALPTTTPINQTGGNHL